MPEPTVVYLVPHTHWDREWYRPFQSFRMQLVDLVDRVLELLDVDGRFRFTLDGQLATVDDYLEVRPEAEQRIRGLIAEGRLSVGPWQFLMDEFLVSGETIVRNLETGWRRGVELGGSMEVGYLPDMFGHIAQMPQILRRAGIGHAAVWRGVPAAIDRSAFEWASPDGSAVRAEYLVHGYGGAAQMLAIPDRVAAKVETLDEAVRPFFEERPVLAMYGADHSEPLPGVADLVERVNESQSRYDVRIATLADYFAAVDGADSTLSSWRGELRSGARANLLMGVTSARIDLKAAAARAERSLERYAEPLQALYGREAPDRFLALAWRRLTENSAHDSIAGCSTDEVSEQVLVRYSEVEQIASGLARRAADRVAANVRAGSIAVLNPSPRPRTDLVEVEAVIPEAWSDIALELPDGTRIAAQETNRNHPLLVTREMTGAEIPTALFRWLLGRELFHRSLNGYAVDRVGGTRRLTLEVDDVPDPLWLDVDELKREVEIAAGAARDEAWQVRVRERPRRTFVAAADAPPFGWTVVRPVHGTGSTPNAVTVEDDAMENGLVAVRVADDGALDLRADGVALSGVARLVDGGDFGDSYNYAPPASDTRVERPEGVVSEVREAGPVRGRLDVVRTYRWPLAVLPDGSARTEDAALVPVTTTVELRAGEPFVRLRISFENPCADHRLRVHIPLAGPASSSFAEGQFAVVERGLEAEGGHGEVPLPTFPARGFVDAGGVALLLEHVTEYELVAGRELALTVLRSVGLISRNVNPYREGPAGPEVSIPAAQLRGPRAIGFAVYPHRGSWVEARVLDQVEAYGHPFMAAHGAGGRDAAPESPLALTGEGVVLSSLRRRGDWLELRLACESPEPSAAVISGAFREAREADLLGRPGASLSLDGARLRLELGAWEVRTVQLLRG
jgi:mannosylglycerate hydrolase